jgi:hypothetical protein
VNKFICLVALLFAGTANASLIVGNSYLDSDGASWEYVGSWVVSDGPKWSLTPGVDVMRNGLEVAELLFGSLGAGFEYATASNDSGLVDHMANYDGWGVSKNTVLAEDFIVDKDGDGLYESYLSNGPWDYTTSDMSAYIFDHHNNSINYAFVGNATTVPEPSAFALLALGMIGLGFSRKKNTL